MNNTRKCTSCQVEMLATKDNFYTKGKRLQAQCKSCFNKYCVQRWRKRKQDTVERMGGACHDCGGEFHPAVFDFHHLVPSEKEFSWTKMRLVSEAKLNQELAKCVMLCANCHRLRHID